MKRKKNKLKMKPRQLRNYIEEMKKQTLLLKHEIECCEFELEQNQCADCYWGIRAELEDMQAIAKDARMLPKVLQHLEQYLAEDEAANGWKGEDRWIVF